MTNKTENPNEKEDIERIEKIFKYFREKKKEVLKQNDRE
jgi:hypothetical protein